MSRITIDFGIDLGTTNSSIAILRGTETEIIKNNENSELTPSAFGYGKNGNQLVGKHAKNLWIEEHGNAAIEFKLQMGTPTVYQFERTGVPMSPEEISAEVLKELRASVRQQLHEDLQAAVITIPAAFELPQCKATERAAQLAGISNSPLLQEPIAAALSYGFQNGDCKACWLVYDLGGGTFDAAVMQVKDDLIQVVNHGGDNNLGGKVIDWKIVDDLLAPSLAAEYKIADFNRGNPRWQTVMRRLKAAAEEAKIALSRYETFVIDIELGARHGFKKMIQFEYELGRAVVAKLAEPVINRSLNICRKVLTEKKLNSESIEKVILVGGPTLAPYLRHQLEQWFGNGKVSLDSTIDPLTVVARGAAIFAGTQKIKPNVVKATQSGHFAILFDYQPVDSKTEPKVGGKVIAPKAEDLSKHTIEFFNQDARPQWRSGKVKLTADGKFFTTLSAERGKQNTFLIDLFDGKGNRLKTNPDRLRYTIGTTISEQTLVHSVGLAMRNNSVLTLFEKGAALPTRRREILQTAVALRAGGSGDLAVVPLIEGEMSIADHNRLIGSVTIHAEKINRDLPLGSEIEVEVAIDESRLVLAKCYVPLLDEEFPLKVHLEFDEIDPAVLQAEVEYEKARLNELKSTAQVFENEDALGIIQRLESEQVELDMDASLIASGLDVDARSTCDKRVRELKVAILELEAKLSWPLLVTEAENEIDRMRWGIKKYGSPSDRKHAASLELETRNLMETQDYQFLKSKIKQLSDFTYDVWQRHPDYWTGLIDWLKERQGEMSNTKVVKELFLRAKEAIARKDVETLRNLVNQLISLLPDISKSNAFRAFGSTVMRKSDQDIREITK